MVASIRNRIFGRRPRVGFTAAELTLVATVIVIMMAIITPGLLRSRQAAQRAQCLNNLYQLGIAFHTYEQAMTCLPPGCVNEARPIYNESIGYHMGWAAQLCPFMDQRNVYATIDQNGGAYGYMTGMAGGTAIPPLMCPSQSAGIPTTMSSYAGCIGGTSLEIDVGNTGLLFLNSSIRDNDIHDGSSQTLLVGEVRGSIVLARAGLNWISGTAATLRSSGVALNTTDNRTYDTFKAVAGGFGSWHSGRVQFLLADGSAKGVSEKTDLRVLKLLGDRDDGNLLPTAADDQILRRGRSREKLSAALQGEPIP